MLRRIFLALSLVLASFAFAACAASGGSFFSTSPVRYALDRAEQAAPSEAAQEAAEARVSAAREANSMFNGAEWAEVEIQGRLIGDGVLSVARDSLGRVRRLSLTSVHQTYVPDSCSRGLSPRFVDLWLDRGSLVSVDHRDSPPVTACTPAYPSDLTSLVFPAAASALAAAGITDLGALPWSGETPPPSAPAPTRRD